MRDVNYEGLGTLLDVLHKAAAGGPAYQWIVDAVNAEILDMKPKPPEAPVVEPTVKPEPVATEEPYPASTPPHVEVEPTPEPTNG